MSLLPPPPPRPPFFVRPFQIGVGILLGWVLRGRSQQARDAEGHRVSGGQPRR